MSHQIGTPNLTENLPGLRSKLSRTNKELFPHCGRAKVGAIAKQIDEAGGVVVG